MADHDHFLKKAFKTKSKQPQPNKTNDEINIMIYI